jgi:hypothetical protein
VRIKQYALKPPFSCTLLNNGAALTGLDGGSVVVTVIGTQGVTELFRDDSPTVNTTTAVVTHSWAAGETDAPGQIWINVDVDLGDGKPVRFPPYGQFVAHVEESPEAVVTP